MLYLHLQLHQDLELKHQNLNLVCFFLLVYNKLKFRDKNQQSTPNSSFDVLTLKHDLVYINRD